MDEIIHNLSKIIARELTVVGQEETHPRGSPDESSDIIRAGRENIVTLRNIRGALEDLRPHLVGGGNV